MENCITTYCNLSISPFDDIFLSPSMIWPLKYAKDYRPYFTIHDSEFTEYTTKTQAPFVLLPAVCYNSCNDVYTEANT